MWNLNPDMVDSWVDIFSLIFTVFAGLFALYTYKRDIKHDQKEATLDAYNRLQEQALDHLNTYAPFQIKEIAQDWRSEEYKRISSYIARIEHFCVGVNQGIYDKKTVYELAHGYFEGAIKSRIDPIISRKNSMGEEFYKNTKDVFAWMEQETELRKRKWKS